MRSAGQPDPTAPSVRVAIYPGSISIPEFRELRDAIDRAAKGTATRVTDPSGKVLAVIAPPPATAAPSGAWPNAGRA